MNNLKVEGNQLFGRKVDRNANIEVFGHYPRSNAINTVATNPLNNYQESKLDDSMLGRFFEKNTNSLLSNLADAGFDLSSRALQNDTFIIKIANYIFNLLPTPIRIFLDQKDVENFLLENRYWLINKLK